MRFPSRWLVLLLLGSSALSAGCASNEGDAGTNPDGGSDGGDGDAVVEGGRPRTQGGQACVTPHWCWENPLPQGLSLAAVHGTASDDVWAVGDGGTILWWGGEAWTPTPSSTTKSLTGVWAATRNDAWAVGVGGTILHWDGTRWSTTAGVTTLDLASVWGTSASDVWVVGNSPDKTSSASLLHWDGHSWSTTATKWWELSVVWGGAPNDYFAAGNADGTLGSDLLVHYDGVEWKPIGSPTATHYEPSASAFFRAPGSSTTWMVARGVNFSTLNAWDGANWTTKFETLADTFYFTGLWGANDTDLWAIGDTKLMHWDGSASTVTDNPIAGVAAYGTGSKDIWQVGGAGGIAHFGADGWTRITKGANAFGVGGNAIGGSGPDDVWDVGTTILHYDGTRWSPVTVPGADGEEWVSIWVASKTSAWILASNGTVAHWDGGAWKKLAERASSGGSGMGSIWASAVDDVWVEDGDAGDSLQHWDGTKWSNIDLYEKCGNASGAAVWGSSPTDLWLVGEYGIMHVSGSLPTPSCTVVDSTVTSATFVWGRNASDVWAVGKAGAAYHYDGSTWTSQPTGVAVDLHSVWGTSANDVWAAGAEPYASPPKSALVHWDGTKWSTVDTGAETNAVWGSDASHMWAVGGYGKVLRYKP